MKILVLDNYDSFTYNLVQMVEKISLSTPDVYRNDKVNLDSVDEYDKIILSPGPGIPVEAGSLMPLIKKYAGTKSILGVCLGHQAIGEVFGGKLTNLDKVFHGVATTCELNNTIPLFKGLPGEIQAGHYHSWIVSDDDFPAELEVTARDEKGFIMALRHREYDVQGVQFHPESVLTPLGDHIIRNWLN